MAAPNIILRKVRPTDAVVQGQTITITANRSLKKSENGAFVHFNSTSTLTATLPPPFKGAFFRFFVKTAASSGNGHTIHPVGSTEKTYAKGFTAAGGKGAVNTQATGAIGDAFVIWSDGTDWFGQADAGTWAREA